MRKLVLAGFLLAGILGAEAQNVASTATLTSGGNLSGTTGSGTYYGVNAGKVSTASQNTFIGTNSGSNTTTGGTNVFLGSSSGNSNLTGSGNVFLGQQSGGSLSSGTNNTMTGKGSGYDSLGAQTQSGLGFATGNSNSFYGASSGAVNNGGNQNCFFGAFSGSGKNTTGSNNTYLGFSSGSSNNGSANVFLGSNSGPVSPNSAGNFISNNLYIDNSANNNPLIWGDFATDQLKLNGTVGIGAVTTFPTAVGGASVANYKLFVTGGILTEEIRVALRTGTIWADYVFANDYKLKPLSELEKFINNNGHLPNVPSAKQVKEEGINVAEMATIQQEKIEELTLYIIAQNKRLEALEAKLNNK